MLIVADGAVLSTVAVLSGSKGSKGDFNASRPPESFRR
jgi:hypothetical protein